MIPGQLKLPGEQAEDVAQMVKTLRELGHKPTREACRTLLDATDNNPRMAVDAYRTIAGGHVHVPLRDYREAQR